jgi:hypothetical protein
MAPDVAKVDADRDLNLGLSAWDFRDEVLRWLLHGKQSLSDPEDLLIPFIRTELPLLLLGQSPIFPKFFQSRRERPPPIRRAN